MTMHPVESSSMTHVGHDGDALHVTFKSGQTYRYAGVDASELDALRNAASAGSYSLGLIRVDIRVRPIQAGRALVTE